MRNNLLLQLQKRGILEQKQNRIFFVDIMKFERELVFNVCNVCSYGFIIIAFLNVHIEDA